VVRPLSLLGRSPPPATSRPPYCLTRYQLNNRNRRELATYRTAIYLPPKYSGELLPESLADSLSYLSANRYLIVIEISLAVRLIRLLLRQQLAPCERERVIMNIKQAREIVGETTDQELREIVAQLESKEILFLESDIEKLRASKIVLKANRNNLRASLNRDVRIG